jgi:hypothetical protein
VAGTCGYGEELSGSINAGNILTSCKVYWLASQEGLCSMEYRVTGVWPLYIKGLCLYLPTENQYEIRRHI